MTVDPRLQARFDSAFANYLRLTSLLRADLSEMFEHERPSLEWRRNFVRAAASLLEGHVSSLRALCNSLPRRFHATLSKHERHALKNERGFDSNSRLKYTLRAAYRIFDLHPLPDFGSRRWNKARRVFHKRHRLMHPKRVQDLGLGDRRWSEMKKDLAWLFDQVFAFLSLGDAKYGTGRANTKSSESL